MTTCALALAITVIIGAVVPIRADDSVQGFGDAQKTCRTWSDGCVTCSREHGCSNIGIACRPGNIQCTDGDRDATGKAQPRDSLVVTVPSATKN